RIRRRDARRARALEGVHAVLLAEDVPGLNDVGAVVHDEPLLAADEVHYFGQPVACVLAESYAQARAAAAAVEVDYEPLPAILDIQDALRANALLGEPHVIQRGDVDAALASAALRVQGEVTTGAQDHFYLETHA